MKTHPVLLPFGIGAIALITLLLAIQPAAATPATVSSTPLPPVTETDGRAGACYSFYHNPPGSSDRPFLPEAVNAGSRWDRFDFIWPNFEPEEGAWKSDTENAYRTLVNDLRSGGIENIVGILLWTPEWAATTGSKELSPRGLDQRPSGWYIPEPGAVDDLTPRAVSPLSTPPQGLYQEWNDWDASDGDGVNYWGRFVYKLVSKFRDDVKYWEMWNEPEWSYFWTGTSGDYAQLLKVGYQATKAACPDCKVLFGGLHYWAEQNYYRWVLSQLADDPNAEANNHYFDIMSVHLYSRSNNTYDEIAKIRSGMTTFGVGDHPIWLTETGVPVWDDGSVDPNPNRYDYAASQQEAADYTIQSYANAIAAGVEKYFFFRTNDEDMSEYFGLMRNDKTHRPSYPAYQVATTYLVSPTFTTRERVGDHRNVTLWATPRGKVSVFWNETPDTSVYTLPAAMPTATLVHRTGATETITATNDVYTFTLPGATAYNKPEEEGDPRDYFIGGEPKIVIENEVHNVPPTSRVISPAGVTCTPAFTVTWEGQDAESGIEWYDVEMYSFASTGWTDLVQRTPLTQTTIAGQDSRSYYFRVRATDRVGNQEPAPEGNEYDTFTAVDLRATATISVASFFEDADRNGERGLEEQTLSDVTLRLYGPDGTLLATTGPAASGTFTTPIFAGDTYRLIASAEDHLGAFTFNWPRGCGEAYVETRDALPLLPAEHVYLPFISR